MKLLTKEILSQFKKQGYTGDKKPEDVKVILKLFHPLSSWKLYATEYNETDRIFFGFVSIFNDHNDELGYSSLNEIESLKVGGLGVERDMYFTSCTLKSILEGNRP